MKQNIHPKYYNNAAVRCACGNIWKTGSTMPEINVEICDKCHPFYTGKEKLVDTRGRVEKFKRRKAKSEEKAKTKTVKKPRRKK
jgi:large subunit ribosomal protein L31